MISTSAVRTAAEKAVRSRMRRWIADPVAAADDSVVIALRPPTESTVADDPDAARDWVRSWIAYTGPGVVDREERRWRSFGTQTVPVRLTLTGVEEICRAAGELTRWRRLVARRAQLLEVVSSPDFDDAVAGWHKKWDALDDADFDRLVSMLAWLLAHPDSGLLIRQLPVEGVHTKWLGAHRGLVEILVAAARGSGELGVHSAPRLIEMAVLDPALLPGWPRIVAAPVADLSALPVAPQVVLIVENRECLHVLPDAHGTVALVGSGNAVGSVAQIGWLRAARVLYWGDLDHAGLVFVGRLRRTLPSLTSVMMEVDTFRRWENLAVDGKLIADNTELPLTDAERAALDLVVAGPHLLEQERIPWDWARAALVDAGLPFRNAGPPTGQNSPHRPTMAPTEDASPERGI
ncbi:DUF3322 domain-containing protein [Gordonia hydrophobica]|uniref:DUF3322 domain-containing protein n=1 Tax=Gordonia hydrophobica TaxID=40516 RepID=A0ABZ2TY33_9ACTN|nr:DUF3322 domain-containing protein [Gordonia hydrophobica]MBM7366968.1 hypothetical protein [Gordonia hydrophobica]